MPLTLRNMRLWLQKIEFAMTLNHKKHKENCISFVGIDWLISFYAKLLCQFEVKNSRTKSEALVVLSVFGVISFKLTSFINLLPPHPHPPPPPHTHPS